MVGFHVTLWRPGCQFLWLMFCLLGVLAVSTKHAREIHCKIIVPKGQRKTWDNSGFFRLFLKQGSHWPQGNAVYVLGRSWSFTGSVSLSRSGAE